MWAPFSGHNAWNCANHSAQSQILYVFGDWRPVSCPKRMTIGRGALCGRPSWAIVASEFRCFCPEDLCGQHWPVSRLILVFYDHNLWWQRCSPFPSAAPRASSADKKVLRCSPCPSVPLRGSKKCSSQPFVDRPHSDLAILSLAKCQPALVPFVHIFSIFCLNCAKTTVVICLLEDRKSRIRRVVSFDRNLISLVDCPAKQSYPTFSGRGKKLTVALSVFS